MLWTAQIDVRFGSKADILGGLRDVRYSRKRTSAERMGHNQTDALQQSMLGLGQP